MAAENGKVEGIGARAYLPRFATCRDIGHRWDYLTWYGSRRIVICTSCDAAREDTMDAFDVVKRKYRYPKGYSWQHEPIPVKSLRRELRRQASNLARTNKSAKYKDVPNLFKKEVKRGRPTKQANV